jgi:hypothetical protein
MPIIAAMKNAACAAAALRAARPTLRVQVALRIEPVGRLRTHAAPVRCGAGQRRT